MQLNEQIRYLQLETGTACNYKCIYCPVAYFPRKGHFLPMELFGKIVRELKYFPNLEKVYLNGYDEPTLNPMLAEIVSKFAHLPVQITLFTNASNLTPDLVDKLVATGIAIDLDIHLAAVNRKDFEHIHQSKLFEKVMKNIKYLQNCNHLDQIKVCISMQARDNPTDDCIYEELKAYFTPTPLPTFRWLPNDRAGVLSHTDYAMSLNHRVLRGCALQNRTQEWIHINANGKVILCCQDYFESHVIGDIAEESLMNIIGSEQHRQYHQWTTGEVEAPDDYICRRCTFAITGETKINNL